MRDLVQRFQKMSSDVRYLRERVAVLEGDGGDVSAGAQGGVSTTGSPGPGFDDWEGSATSINWLGDASKQSRGNTGTSPLDIVVGGGAIQRDKSEATSQPLSYNDPWVRAVTYNIGFGDELSNLGLYVSPDDFLPSTGFAVGWALIPQAGSFPQYETRIVCGPGTKDYGGNVGSYWSEVSVLMRRDQIDQHDFGPSPTIIHFGFSYLSDPAWGFEQPPGNGSGDGNVGGIGSPS